MAEMKHISELISELESIRRSHGDLKLAIVNSESPRVQKMNNGTKIVRL